MVLDLIILLGTGVWLTLWLLRDGGRLWSRRGLGLALARRCQPGPSVAGPASARPARAIDLSRRRSVEPASAAGA
jgi:hypothetical protein